MGNDSDTFKVVLYARVSTNDKGQTNETQIRELQEYVKRNGYEIADNGDAIYTDEQTAKNDKRNGFRLMKGRISEGDIDFVIARNQDRISREPSDYQNFLEYCRQYRVRVRFSDNSSQPETESGVIMDSVYAGIAKADNMKRSTNTKKGIETAKLKGIHCGRKIAFCWSDEVEKNEARIQLEGKHKTVIMSLDDILVFAKQGMTIHKAAERYVGVSYMTLTRALESRGSLHTYEELRMGRKDTQKPSSTKP